MQLKTEGWMLPNNDGMNPFDPERLKSFRTSARHVKLNGLDAIELAVRFSNSQLSQDLQDHYVIKNWYNSTKYFALLGSFVGRDDSELFTEYLVDQLAEPAPRNLLSSQRPNDFT